MSKATIKWDGRDRTATAIMRRAAETTVSTSGGAPGIPRMLWLHPSGYGKGAEITVKRGQSVGFLSDGRPHIVIHRKRR